MSVIDILSIQLYTLRLLENLDRILDAVAEAGYHSVETVGSHLDDAETVRAKLDARGLRSSSSHVGLPLSASGRTRLRRPAGLSERPGSSCPPCRRTSGTWTPRDGVRWAASSGQAAERFQAQGIALGYHNHHWELKPKEDDKTALESEGRRRWPLDLINPVSER